MLLKMIKYGPQHHGIRQVNKLNLINSQELLKLIHEVSFSTISPTIECNFSFFRKRRILILIWGASGCYIFLEVLPILGVTVDVIYHAVKKKIFRKYQNFWKYLDKFISGFLCFLKVLIGWKPPGKPRDPSLSSSRSL